MSDADGAAVAERERLWMEAWRKKDRLACESVLGDDFVLTSARGSLMNREQWLEGAMGPFKCDEFRWEELHTRLVAPEVIVVNARTYQRAQVGGQDWSGIFLLTDVWVKRQGRWVVVARHGTGPLTGA